MRLSDVCIMFRSNCGALDVSLTVFTQRNFVKTKGSVILYRKRPFCVFEPLWGSGETYDDHLRLIGKRAVDFLLVLFELFSLGVTAEALRANSKSKSAISLQRGKLTQNFR